MSNPSEPLYIGVKGHVVAIDRATGSELWRAHLAGSSYVTVCSDRGGLYAGTNGKVYCLDPTTGSVVWMNNLDGLGYNLITFSSNVSTGVTAAVAQTAQRRAEAAAAGAGA